MMNLNKGDRIAASWFEAYPASLAGMQLKCGARQVSLTGIVRHIRGDHPENPTIVRVFVDPDYPDSFSKLEPCEKCGTSHVMVDPKHITGILDSI